MRFVFLLFILVPLVELYLLLWVAGQIGFWPTLAITVVTGVLGASFAKREGLRAWREWNLALKRRESPQAGLVEGALIVLGGVLLLTPGVLTDALGFWLLLPPTRRATAARVRQHLERRFATHLVTFGAPGRGEPVRQGPFLETEGEDTDRVDR